MSYLADACALIAFFGSDDPATIMPRAAPLMVRSPVSVIAPTVWEITRKIALGKLPPFYNRDEGGLSNMLREQRFLVGSFDWQDAEAANALPDIHKDPFDRMLIAVALRADLPVITSDVIFAAYGVRTIW